MVHGGVDSFCSTGWPPPPTGVSPPLPPYQVCWTCLRNYYCGEAGIENLDLGFQHDLIDVPLVLNFFLQEFSAGQSTLPLCHMKYYDIEV